MAGRIGGARLRVDFDEPDLDPWEAAERAAVERKKEAGAEAEAEEVAGLTFREFGVERVPDPERGRIDLERFAFQRERYDEESVTERKSVDMKANQVGSSTRAVREGLYHADRGRIVIYAFPTSNDLGKFSRQRIAPALRRSEYLRQRMSSGDVDRVDQKQIGFGWLYGYGTEKPIEVVNADVLIIDEYDFCFAAGTMILTRRGHLPIEQVTVGDEVLTHRGRWRRVTGVGSRQATETVVVSGHGVPGLRATPEHPVYSRARLGLRVVTEGYERMVPRGQRSVPCEVNNCFSNQHARGLCQAHYQRQKTHGDVDEATPVRRLYVRGGAHTPRVRHFGDATWTPVGDLVKGSMLGHVLPPPEEDDCTPEWWWFVGRYLADGCSDGRSVHIDCSTGEADGLEERLAPLFPNLRRRPYKHANAVRFSVSSRALCERLVPFGRLAHGKRLTGHALALDHARSHALLYGYLSGDGSYNAAKRMWSAVSVSRALALGVVLLVERVEGLVATCCRCAPSPMTRMPESAGGRPVTPRPSYRVAFAETHRGPLVEGDGTWKPVKSVDRATGARVWNLSVEEDESYLADNCIVHNCNQANLDASTRRVSGPFSSGILRYLSIPSYPGFGIAEEFAQTDQRVWTVKCGACNEWNPIKGFEAWTANVDEQRACLVCRCCRRELDVREGGWVASFPEREVRGYHTPKLIVPGLDLRPLIVASKKRRPLERQAFHNRDLGWPYSPAEGRLSREAVLANVRPDLRMLESLTSVKVKTMGIDVGTAKPLTVTIREQIDDAHTRLVYAAQVEDEPGGGSAMAQCEALMRLFGVNLVGVDNGPDGRWATTFVRKFPGRAYRIAYFTPQGNRKTDVNPWNVDDTEQFCSVWRLRAIDAMLAEFRMQHSLIPPEEQLPHDERGDCEYVTHLTNLQRHRQESPDGTPVVTYVKLGPDDFAHSEVYNLVAQELYWRGVGMGVVLGQGPEPLAEKVDFKRSALDDYDRDPDYHAGPDDDFGGDIPELGGFE